MKNTSFVKIFFLVILFFSLNVNAQVTTLNENFTTCVSSIPSTWVAYSVVGTDSWHCNTTGYTGNCAYINGYSGGTNNANEDWLISPLLNLSAYTAPNLSFWSRTTYAGNPLELLLSTNYSGSGNPNSSTWITLPVTLPSASSNTWTLSENINLTSYKSTPFRIAYKYTSTTTAASSWKIDEVNILDGALTSLNKRFINVGQCTAGSQTPVQSFSFTMSAINGTFDLGVSSPFLISKDNVNFGSQISYTNSASNISQTVYVKIAPTVADKVYRSDLTFTYNGSQMNDKVQLLGTSIPDNATLRVLSWNMRWFGSPTWCNCDTAIARTNATKILKDINADVYCLQEVVSNSQIALIAASLGSNYGYTVSPFCTGVTNSSSGLYQNCQKLAFIYNTNKIQNVGNFGLLSSTYPGDTLPYFCFSSGRFPYIMKAVLTLNGGVKDTIIFSDIHAKSDNTQADYDRRVCATQKMTDSLNALFPSNKIMVIGDYNDYLEGTTVSGQTISSYQYLLNNGFSGITLPSLYPNQATYVGSTNHIIDNIVCTPNLKTKYVDSSFFIFTETYNYITDYENSTSDHYPIMSYYKFNFPNGIKEYYSNDEQSFFEIINPSNTQLIINNSMKGINSTLKVYDIYGKIVYTKNNMLEFENILIPTVHTGIYFVELTNEKGRCVKKWQVIE